MTDQLILDKEHLTGFLRKISKGRALVAPVRNSHGDTLFEVVSCPDSISLDLESRPVMPPKDFFLPRTEILFNYEYRGDEYRFDEVLPDGSSILFGLRSCDLWAILFLDVVFQENFKDRYYLNRRSSSVLINIGCRKPMHNCFCKSTKSGPFLTQGYDLQLTDLGDRFFIEIGRPRGRALVEEWDYFFRSATDHDIDEQYEIVLEAESSFEQIIDFNTATSRFANNEVDDDLWQELGNRCQGCGGCAYVCPTCYCFNIVDRPVSDTEGQRLRMHDACTLAGFTRLAGGHNPRHERSSRIRRRFYHKLCYDMEKYHRLSCVGCGRCVEICFGRIDMIQFVRMVCERPEKSRQASMRLGEILLQAGLISDEALKIALEKQAGTGKPLGIQLIEDGLTTTEEIARALGLQLGIPEPSASGGEIGE